MIYSPNGNLIKFSHMNRICFSAGNAVANPILTNWHQKPPKPSFPSEHINPIHQCLGRHHSPPQMAARLVHTFLCKDANYLPHPLIRQTDRWTDRWYITKPVPIPAYTLYDDTTWLIIQTKSAASMLASAFSNWWSPLHTGVKSDLHITPENVQTAVHLTRN